MFYTGPENSRLVYVNRDNYGRADYCDATAQYQSGVWHHCCGITADEDDHLVYFDGVAGEHLYSTVAYKGYDRISIAAFRDSSPSGYTTGKIAEAAVWNVALTADEVKALAKGFSPLFVRPANLKAYWPLIRLGSTIDAPDLVGGYHLTAYNGPITAPHCRIFRPAPPLVAPVEGLVTPIPVIMNHYRKLRTA